MLKDKHQDYYELITWINSMGLKHWQDSKALIEVEEVKVQIPEYIEDFDDWYARIF